MKKNFLIIGIIVLLSIPAVFYLFVPGFFQSDDGEWMIIRFSAFYQALREGQFPVRYLPRLNFGYGYPVSNFLYPGFMYLGVPIHLIGFNVVDTIKIILIGSMISSGVFTYFWLSTRFKKIAAFAGALVYVYTPYHLFDLYSRGSVGEILALGIVPFILWMIEKKNLFFVSMGLFFLILAHNTLSLLFFPLLFIYACLIKKNSYVRIFTAFAFGVCISAFFTIPAILELPYTAFSQTRISTVTEYFASFALIGASTFVILGLTIYVALRHKKNDGLFLLFLGINTLSIFLSSSISTVVWNIIPSSIIQFPFRLLSYTVLASSYLMAFIISSYSKKQQWIVLTITLVVLAQSALLYAKPSTTFNKDIGMYETNEDTTTVKGEYRSTDARSVAREHYKNKIEYKRGEGSIQDVSYNSKKIVFTVVANTDSSIQVNTMYFPGWKAYVNGKEWKILIYNKDFGQMGIVVPKGTSKIELLFTETPLRIGANIISVTSFVGLCLIHALQYKRKYIV